MGAIGLALPSHRVDDRFVTALVHALAEPIIGAGRSLVTRIVPDAAAEQALYRHWAQVGGVDGVVLLDAGPDDARVALLRSLRFPLAAIVDVVAEPDFPAVVVDFDASLIVLRSFLASRPERPAVYISGPRGNEVSVLDPDESTEGDRLLTTVRAETAEQSAAAVEQAVERGPVTLVFDTDSWAVAALHAVGERGRRVPDEVAIVSATNSALCQSSTPAITAIDRRGDAIGAQLGRLVLEAVAGTRATREPSLEPFVSVGETA